MSRRYDLELARALQPGGPPWVHDRLAASPLFQVALYGQDALRPDHRGEHLHQRRQERGTHETSSSY